jgi:hypothetical protein
MVAAAADEVRAADDRTTAENQQAAQRRLGHDRAVAHLALALPTNWSGMVTVTVPCLPGVNVPWSEAATPVLSERLVYWLPLSVPSP